LVRREKLKLMVVICIYLSYNITVCDEIIYGTAKPFQEIDVATSEPGIISRTAMKVGDKVKKGQPLVKLDTTLLEASLKIAIERTKVQGTLKAAETNLKLAQKKLSRLLLLQQQNHARIEEVEQARAEEQLAAAQLLSVNENLRIARYEVERIKKQIYLRIIRAPASGIIREVSKEKGESVAPNESICKIVILNPINVVGYPTLEQANVFRINEKVKVSFLYNQKTVVGKVSFIDPVTDATSNTVKIIVEVNNENEQLRTGVRCILKK